MGMGSAVSLAHAGHQVAGCEVRPCGGTELLAAGGTCVNSPAALPSGLDALIVFVVNAAQADQVLFGPEGALSHVAEDDVVLCCTTVAPEAARSLGEQVTAAGGHGARDDAFVIRIWQALAGIDLPGRPAPEAPNA